MIRPFGSLTRPPRRPPGRCPNCHRLALEPEPPAWDGEPSSAGRPHRCARCGSRFHRRFAQSWQELTTNDDLAEVETPRGILPRLPFPRLPRPRFKIAHFMILIVWFAINLAALSAIPDDPFRMIRISVALVTLAIANGLVLNLVRILKTMSRPPFAQPTLQIVAIGLSPFLLAACAGVLWTAATR